MQSWAPSNLVVQNILPSLLLLPGAAGFSSLPKLPEWLATNETAISALTYNPSLFTKEVIATGQNCLKGYDYLAQNPHPCTIKAQDGDSGILTQDVCTYCERLYCECFDLPDDQRLPEDLTSRVDTPGNGNCVSWKYYAQDVLASGGDQMCPDFSSMTTGAATFLDNFCTMRVSSMTDIGSAKCSSLSTEKSCQMSYSVDGDKQYPCEWDAKNSRCQAAGTFYTCSSFCLEDRSAVYDLRLSSDMQRRSKEHPELEGLLVTDSPQNCGRDTYLSKDPATVNAGELTCADHFVYGFALGMSMTVNEMALDAVQCEPRMEYGQDGTYWRCFESSTKVCKNMPPTIDDTIDEGYCKAMVEFNKVDVTPTNEWCNSAPERRADKAECERHFRTGSNGHVYPCFYDEEAKACYMRSESIMCCDHLCAGLATRENINADNPGFDPWCGTDASRNGDEDACQAAYWTGGDMKTYPCVYNRVKATGETKCRLSVSDACAC